MLRVNSYLSRESYRHNILQNSPRGEGPFFLEFVKISVYYYKLCQWTLLPQFFWQILFQYKGRLVDFWSGFSNKKNPSFIIAMSGRAGGRASSQVYLFFSSMLPLFFKVLLSYLVGMQEGPVGVSRARKTTLIFFVMYLSPLKSSLHARRTTLFF